MQNKTLTMPEAVLAMATITAATGKLIPAVPAKGDKPAVPPTVELTLETEHNGPLVMTLAQFDDIYRGLVRCWPQVKPLKNDLAAAVRDAAAADRQATKDKVKADKDAAAAKKKAEREAKEKAAKEAKEKAAQEKADKAAADAKAKADKAAADAKEKADKAAADAKAAEAKAKADAKGAAPAKAPAKKGK